MREHRRSSGSIPPLLREHKTDLGVLPIFLSCAFREQEDGQATPSFFQQPTKLRLFDRFVYQLPIRLWLEGQHGLTFCRITRKREFF